MKQYFLILNAVNLGQYFSRALIIPSKYIENWIYDIQSKNKSNLLLCDKILITETTCALEIVLTDSEVRDLKLISDHFYLCKKPLPVTRIKQIYFINEDISKNTIYNIQNGNAYIPEELISEFGEVNDLQFPEDNHPDKNKNEVEWSMKNKEFNQVLGGFALMKIGVTDDYKEYSENYFNYLSYINYVVKKVVSSLDNDFDEKLLKSIDIENDKSKSILYDLIDTKVVNKISSEKIPINYLGNIEFEKIKNPYNYILAILATYGRDYGKTMKIDDFVFSVISGKFRVDSLEKLCLSFGINQGYNAFKNKYVIENNEVSIKFKFNSELDYTIVESIYQYVFNSKKDNYSFEYLNSWCQQYRGELDKKRYDTIKVFDKDVIIKKKVIPGSVEYIQNILEQFSKINIFDKIKFSVSEIIEKVIFDLEALKKEELEEKDSVIRDLKTKVEDLEKLLDEKDAEKISFNIKDLDEQEKSKLESNEEFEKMGPEDNTIVLLDNTKKNPFEQSEFSLEIEKDIINARSLALNKITTLKDLKLIASYVGIKSLGKFNLKDIEKLRIFIIEKEKDIIK